MANVSVYNMEGKEVGKMDLNDAVLRSMSIWYTWQSFSSLPTIVRARRRQRRALRFPAEEESPGDRKGPVMRDRVPQEHLNGRAAAWYSLRHRGIILLR